MAWRAGSPRLRPCWSTGGRSSKPPSWKTWQKPSTRNLPQPNKPVALVTGASRGIGRAIACELSKTHQVVATYRENREAADSLRNETGAEIIPSDIGSPGDRDELVARLKATYNSLDLLVNNAGMAPRERR